MDLDVVKKRFVHQSTSWCTCVKNEEKEKSSSSSRVRINDVMNLICSLGSNLTVEIKWKATFSSYIIDQTLISSMSKGIWGSTESKSKSNRFHGRFLLIILIFYDNIRYDRSDDRNWRRVAAEREKREKKKKKITLNEWVTLSFVDDIEFFFLLFFLFILKSNTVRCTYCRQRIEREKRGERVK